MRRIIRGYRRRDKLKHQLRAECAYAAIIATRDSHGKTVKDLFPMLFEDDDEEEHEPISQEEIDELQAEMAAMNNKNPE